MKVEPQTDRLTEPMTENPLETVEEVRSPKKNILPFIIGGVVVLFIVGFFVIRAMLPKKVQQTVTQQDQTIEETLAPADSSIIVALTKSTTKDNTVVILVKGLGGKYVSIGYELQYESGGVGKGVTSGSKPLDVSGQDEFTREIYLGTCSKNVCKPDVGVTKVSLVLEFTDKDGKKSQFSKDFDL